MLRYENCNLTFTSHSRYQPLERLLEQEPTQGEAEDSSHHSMTHGVTMDTFMGNMPRLNMPEFSFKSEVLNALNFTAIYT